MTWQSQPFLPPAPHKNAESTVERWYFRVKPRAAARIMVEAPATFNAHLL
jgi:hypothetical protein